MRRLLVFIFLVFYHIASGSTEILINEKFEDAPLKSVLTLLTTKYQLKIAYSDRAISDYNVNASLINQSVPQAFQRILKSTPLTFEQIEADAIIIKKSLRNNTDEQTFPLIGVVMDAQSQERLPYAYVWLKSEEENFLTNVDGYFSLELKHLPSEILISYLGYKDTTIVIDQSRLNKRLYVGLETIPMQLKEVVIKANKNNDFELGVNSGKIDVNPRLAYSMPSTGEVDIMRTIQMLPGINATNEFSSGLVIQGGNTSQNLFILDGFTIYHMDHFFGYFSAINPSAIKSVQLYKSGYDARYGGRTSGVVDISGKEGNLNKTSGSLGINLLSVNTTLEVPLKRNTRSLFFSGRRSYTDILSTTLFDKIFENFVSYLNDETTEKNSGTVSGGMGHHGNSGQNTGVSTTENEIQPEFYYSDLNLKFSTKIGLKDHLSLSFYDSNDILNFNQKRTSNVGDTLTVTDNLLGLINWGNIGASVKWSRLWNESHYTNALVSYAKYQSEYNENGTSTFTDTYNQSEDIPVSFEQTNSIDDITFRIDHEWSFPRDQMIRLGMQTSVLGTLYRGITDNITFVEHIEQNNLIGAFYGLGIFRPFSRLILNAGMRSNYYSVNTRWYLEPRVALSYQLNNGLNLKAAYGIYHQFINQSNTKNALQGSRDFWLLSDDASIPIQKSRHITAGFGYKAGDFVVNAEYFNKTFDGLLEYAFSSGGLVTEFDNYEDLFFQGQGSSNGLEFLIKKSTGRLDTWLGYTIGITEYEFDDLNEGQPFYADFDQRHEINAFTSYHLGSVELFGTWVYGSGKPYSQITGNTINDGSMGNFNSHVTVVETQGKNTVRLPAYHRLDIGGKYTHQFSDVDMELALTIFNLYNQKNIIDYSYYQIMGGHGMSTSIIQSNGITSMGITPNLSLTINF